MLSPKESKQTQINKATKIKISRNLLNRLCQEEELEFFGVVDLQDPHQRFEAFTKWLAAGMQAEMNFLNRYLEIRKDPSLLHPQSVCAVIIGCRYYQGKESSDKTKIAQYARLKDYHKVLRKKLNNLHKKIEETTQTKLSMRICIDSAPLLEKALAEKTSRGFIGKNTLFIHPEKGSYFLLSELLCAFELELDPSKTPDPHKRTELGGCGTCKRCQVHCPSGALDKDYRLDSRKCLAYYSIEHRKTVPLKFWPYFAQYFFGCDLCQQVCPYNRGAKEISQEKVFLKNLPPLEDIVLMNQENYEAWFGGTALTRAKKHGLQRNALIALVAKNSPKLKETLKKLKEAKDLHPLLAATLQQVKDFQR